MKKTTQRHIVTKKPVINKTIKAATESSHVTYRGIKKKMTAGFLSEIMQMGIQWSNIFKVLKEKNPC